MPLPEEFIYQLKLANPIESTIGNYINLLRRGKDIQRNSSVKRTSV